MTDKVQQLKERLVKGIWRQDWSLKYQTYIGLRISSIKYFKIRLYLSNPWVKIMPTNTFKSSTKYVQWHPQPRIEL